MVAHAVAGPVVDRVSWQFGRLNLGNDQPGFPVQVLVGATGAVVSGVGLNLSAGHDLLDSEPWTFTLAGFAGFAGFVLLAMLRAGARRTR